MKTYGNQSGNYTNVFFLVPTKENYSSLFGTAKLTQSATLITYIANI